MHLLVGLAMHPLPPACCSRCPRKGHACPCTPCARRLKDAADLPAAVLPKLLLADPLQLCWPSLSSAAAQQHPRWVEMCARVAEAHVAQGRPAAALQPLQDAVQQHIRLAARAPVLAWPAWTLGVAAGEVQQSDPAGPDDRRRVAAAILLQRRLPQLLQRRRHVLRTRRLLGDAAPWLAHLRCCLGVAAARAALGVVAAAKAQPAAEPAGAVPDPVPPAGARRASNVGNPAAKKPGSAGPAAKGKGGDKAAAAGGKAAPAADGADAVPLALQALAHLAAALQLASRSGPGAWQELLSCLAALWNVGRPLLAGLPQLLQPVQERASWQLAPAPPPRVPALVLEPPSGEQRAVRAVCRLASGAMSTRYKLTQAAAAERVRVMAGQGSQPR